MRVDQSKVLILGFCKEGPYKHAISLLSNPEVKWLPWGYHIRYIDPLVLNDLLKGHSLKDVRVAFACWSTELGGKTSVLRFGRIDHFAFNGSILRLTVFLENYDDGNKNPTISVNDSKLLCFYLYH